MSRKLLATLLFCVFSASLLAAEPAAKSEKSEKKAASKPAPRVPARQRAPVAENAESADDLLPRSVFEVLLGEMALQRGALDVALSAYVDLARRSQDPLVLARTIEIASHMRQFEVALEFSRLWVKVEPASFKAQQALTTSLLLLNRTDELATQIGVMLERDKSRLPENLLALNRLLARLPDRKAVNQLLEKVATPYAGIAEAHYAMAVAALSAGDQGRARSESAKALEMRADWEAAVLLRAQILAKDNADEAVHFLENFVSHNPTAYDARLNLARLLLAGKRFGEAKQHFDYVLSAYPNSVDVLYPAAILALQQNDLVGGRLFLERLLTTEFADKSSVHYFLGQIDEDEKKDEAALAHYKAVGAGEQYMAARSRMAQLLVKRDGLDEALKMLRASQAHTSNEKAFLATAEATLLRDGKRFQEAHAVLENALKAQPENVDLLYDSALIAERIGKFDLLESRLKRVIELRPEHAHALNALGYTLADRHLRLDEAYKLVSKALALAPNDPFILDSLGWVYFRQGKLKEALDTLQSAYKLRPDPEIAAHLGEVLWKMDRQGEAGRLWDEAASKFPNNEDLLKTIKKFKP